ncbi:thiolase C-terminal domain-containing protein [Streptomyces fulvoviolaceus]|uniref:thiolase C-terminal domain-containing protein n=1 Tax=Streptomyces fulvoviolaceus TaxID=285535 RepID=UPI0004C62961|nr:OB-fold domain-containing protein [Streptomyces fulvoviolaceus]MCT9075596.1 OB-fold domain-containing protein [Streptomyces fulvoviolaceus]
MTQVERPLPQPTLASAEFWSSGADGVLRISHCADCDRHFHPPLPVCPSCRSRAVALAPVSGKAVVVGFSVNHQKWLPRFPPPYVVAVVALAEDDRARLTTNIVGCEPDEVRIGMRVRVRIEQHEDVYIPLFEPDPETEAAEGPGPLPEPREVRVRPMASPRKYEDKVALTGVGQSRVGRRLMVDPLSLTVDACLAAVADAGLDLDDIDGLSTYPGPSPDGMSEGGITALTEALQLHPTWVNGAREVSGQIGSITAGMLAVAAGLCRHVLCFRTVWESSHGALVRSGQWQASGGRATGMFEFRAPFGAMSAAQWIGCNASHYMHRYGVGREALGAIAVTARAGAARNPEALHRDPLTLDDYFDARMITTPFGLYDCDVPCDGAVAVVVSALETAYDRPRPPVLVESVGTAVAERLSWDQDTLTHLPQSKGPSAHLWTRTDLTPADVDVALLYDGFTFNALSWIEGLGFCGPGEASDFIADGKTIALDGDLPLNPHGGQLSAGRLHGYGFVREAMLQLRGDAHGRQVEDARVAVVTAGGGVPSGAMLLRMGE